MRRWQPDIELDRLLDALEADILAATEPEIHLALLEARCSVASAAGEIRRLIADLGRDRDGQELHLRNEEAAAFRAHPARTYVI